MKNMMYLHQTKLTPRIGDWGCTSSGRRYYPQDTREGDLDIHDIAHALSLQCRFGGHVRRFYSVAEHSVHVSYECGEESALHGLLHDASESYLVDVPRPAKYAPGMDGYIRMERGIMNAVYYAFIYPRTVVVPAVPEWRMPHTVKVADERMLATEARDLMPEYGHGGVTWWSLGHQPYEHLSVRRPWSPSKARRRFLRRYRELTGNLTTWDRVVIRVRTAFGKDGCR